MSWKLEYIVLIMISTIVDYISAIAIYQANIKRVKRFFLLLSLLVNLGMLAGFKYFNFFSESISDFFKIFSIEFSPFEISVLLPVGISFYTFQTISYTIDVYNGKIKPERHLGIFAVYVSFFPQLVAGPIERAGRLIPQFKLTHSFDYERFLSGLRRIIWGFFKKLVIADRLAVFVNLVYSDVSSYSGPYLFVATLFFAFQIYCDFSAYSDIAIGSARIMGIDLIENFKRPYASKSVAEFWRRWHISLSTWFSDYVFTPMYRYFSGLKSLKKFRPKVKHFVSFAISMMVGESLLGLWHGANYTYIIFGFYYGVLISLYYLLRKPWDKLPSVLRVALVFVMTLIGWVFFRANSLDDAWYILVNVFSNWSSDEINEMIRIIGRKNFIYSLGFIIFMETLQWFDEHKKYLENIYDTHIIIRWSIYYFVILSILLLGVFSGAEFIYFDF